MILNNIIWCLADDIYVLFDSSLMKEITEAFSIPLSCPKCEGKMIAVKYDDPSQIYDEHSIQMCKECDYQIQTDDFKMQLLTV